VDNKDKILAILEALDAERQNSRWSNRLTHLAQPAITFVDDEGDKFSHTLMSDIDFGELYEWLGKSTVTP
jgi:hypothetical protein